MARRSAFITLEGGEGAGKSTLAASLGVHLESAGLDVLRTREPGGSPGAEAIRQLVLFPETALNWQPRTEALLMCAARVEHIARTLRPALAAGRLILCDRFADSTRAYQGVSGGLTEAELDALEAITVGDMRPHLTLLLDGPPETFLARRQSRGEMADRFELRDLDFHRAVRARFLAIASREPDRVVRLDATQPTAAILSAALGAIRDRLGFVLA